VGSKNISSLLGQRLSALGRRHSLKLFAASLLLVPGLCFGAGKNVLIVNGSSTTPETDTTNSVTTNLSADVAAAGGTVTVSDTIPANLSGYVQVWDVRWFNSAALSNSDIAQYVAYLLGGGTMFVVGENALYGIRNNSVIALVAAAGGGSLTYVVPLQTQTVLAPFTLPNPVSSIYYPAPGGAVGPSHPGTGAFMTLDTGNNGSGIWWTKGTLANAANGTLAVVFDPNFMEASADQLHFMTTSQAQNSQNFLNNLVAEFAQISGGSTPAAPIGTPALSEWGLILLGLLLVALAARTLRTGPALR
jgi:hypothetical protein